MSQRLERTPNSDHDADDSFAGRIAAKRDALQGNDPAAEPDFLTRLDLLKDEFTQALASLPAYQTLAEVFTNPEIEAAFHAMWDLWDLHDVKTSIVEKPKKFLRVFSWTTFEEVTEDVQRPFPALQIREPLTPKAFVDGYAISGLQQMFGPDIHWSDEHFDAYAQQFLMSMTRDKDWKQDATLLPEDKDVIYGRRWDASFLGQCFGYLAMVDPLERENEHINMLESQGLHPHAFIIYSYYDGKTKSPVILVRIHQPDQPTIDANFRDVNEVLDFMAAYLNRQGYKGKKHERLEGEDAPTETFDVENKTVELGKE